MAVAYSGWLYECGVSRAAGDGENGSRRPFLELSKLRRVVVTAKARDFLNMEVI
jgi:hypothetical protein